MPEMYARFLQQPSSPWVNAAPALADGHHDVLQQAVGGIVFVDELATLSKNQQKHLAFLAARAEKTKTRMVSWTTEDPRLLVEHGFDSALLAQLSGLTIMLPALREHAEDIPDFANLMLTQLVETRVCPPRHFSTAGLNLLRNFSWPRNLDDLQAAVRNLALTALDEEIGAADVERVLRPLLVRTAETTLALEMPLREARETFERAYFEYHLQQEDGSIVRVAEKSGLERTHLYRKLKSLGIAVGRREERDGD